MREWQPIETAPKDGTWIDLWATRTMPEQGWVVSKRFANCFWCGDCWVHFDSEFQPTHWMPLPQAPR